jgi:hydrogenase maturation protein HypF
MSAVDNRALRAAVRLRITGTVQGVGFRPFVYRVAEQYAVTGWVLNGEDGVHVVAEASPEHLERFIDTVRMQPPSAAYIASFDVETIALAGFERFEIRESTSGQTPTVRISPDLAVCEDCVRELFDPSDRRYGYPYINCTNCGPRYSIIHALPYDRSRTVMNQWPMCEPCRREYDDPLDRRFHAQPIACRACGPTVYVRSHGATPASGSEAIARAARLLARGAIVAVKGIGGYHLACDAANPDAVEALRQRKYRKERPFAVMARDLATARTLVALDVESERVLTSVARPIVLAPARRELLGVAPHNRDLGVMLPYTPIHHLLFAAGAPDVLVMTSANRSSEPIAYSDADARASLAEIADAFLVGERAIARRVDDAIVRVTDGAPVVLRRSRGLAPQAVAVFPAGPPILALGGDLKNAMILVVDGQAFASQHIGDLEHLSVAEAFESTARDLCEMYALRSEELLVAHDLHPGYRSTAFAQSLPGTHVALQHHRAHVASVLAERGAWDATVLAFAFDGTGYGDDGAIWGGEVFAGSLCDGLERVMHLRSVPLPGGDAAARFPVQAAAGFLYDVAADVDFTAPPFAFPERYARARVLIGGNLRVFTTSSVGRLFDTVAALAGFTREQSFEGQAAMWLEHLARYSREVIPYAFAIEDGEFDPRPMLRAIIEDRFAGRAPGEIARAFHLALAHAIVAIADAAAVEHVVVTGGVFQNQLLVEMLAKPLGERLWLNRVVPPNDGGLSLGQAALAAAQRMVL